MKKVFSFIVLSIVLTSCEDFFEMTVPMDIPPHQSKMAPTAVIGNINAMDKDNKIYLSKSIGALENDNVFSEISDASVSVTSGHEVYKFSELQDSEKGFYKPDVPINFVVGQAYQLKIEKNGLIAIQSTQIYPSKVPVIAATLTGDLLKVKFEDPATESDYYALILVVGKEGSFTTRIEPFDFNAIRTGYYRNCIMFSDETFNGKVTEIKTKLQYSSGSLVKKVILYHVTKDYYKFYKSLHLNQQTGDNPFAEPVIMYTNIENGYGLFALKNGSEYIIP